MKENLLVAFKMLRSEGFYYLISILFLAMPFIKPTSSFVDQSNKSLIQENTSCNSNTIDCRDFLFAQTSITGQLNELESDDNNNYKL